MVAIKSRKVGKTRPIRDDGDMGYDPTVSMRPPKRRKTTLAQLERRVKRRRVTNGANTIGGIMQRFGVFVKNMNSRYKLPSDREVNEWLWK